MRDILRHVILDALVLVGLRLVVLDIIVGIIKRWVSSFSIG